MTFAWLLSRRFAGGLFGGLLAGIVLLIMVPVVIGWRPYTVLTGSMRPVIQPGDVVMDKPVRVPEMHVGDIVTFNDPTRRGRLVTHRVRSLARGPEFTAVETRGDANNTSERWNIQNSDRVGKVEYVIPKVGRVANLIRNPAGVVALVILPVLGLGYIALRAIWREDDEDDDTPGDDGAGAGEPGDDPDEPPTPA